MLNDLSPLDDTSHSQSNLQTLGDRMEQMKHFRTRPFLQKVETAITSFQGLNAHLSDMMPRLREVWVHDFYFDAFDFSAQEAKAMRFDQLWSAYSARFSGPSGKVQDLVEHCPKLAIRGRIIRYKPGDAKFSEVRILRVHRNNIKLTNSRLLT